MARRVLGVISVVLTVLGVLAAADVRRGPSAAAVLDDARAYVGTHESVRFVGTMSVRIHEGSSEFGSSQSITSHIKGEIAAQGRTHAVIAAGDEGATESITADDVVYIRTATTVAGLATAKYAKVDTAAAAGVMDLDAEQAKDLDIGALLRAAGNPTKVGTNDKVTTIQADVDVARLLGTVAARDVDWITLRVGVHDSGQVRSAVQTTRGDGATVVMKLRYSEWGGTFAIAEPGTNEIDPTPGIEEEQIAAFKSAPLLMPKAIPAGWELVYAGVLPAAETKEKCDQVELDYEDPDDPNYGYLYIYEFPNKCAKPFRGAGVAPFTAGRYKGFGSYSDEDGSLVQITVGATTVQADSDLTLEELALVLKDLVPLNLRATPGQIPGIGGGATTAA